MTLYGNWTNQCIVYIEYDRISCSISKRVVILHIKTSTTWGFSLVWWKRLRKYRDISSFAWNSVDPSFLILSNTFFEVSNLVWKVTLNISYKHCTVRLYTLINVDFVAQHVKHKLNQEADSRSCRVSVGFSPFSESFMCILRTALCWFKPHTMAAKLLYNVFCF